MLLSLSANAVQGEQLFDPYGHPRYATGVLGTDKGYTGQFTDTATGLDYYNARYYLRDIGVFLSPDSVQGNAQGMNPYSYVAGNPETRTDPTGQKIVDPCDPNTPGDCGGSGGGGNGGCPSGEHPVSGGCSPNTGTGSGSNPGSGSGSGSGGCGSAHSGACTIIYGCDAKCRAKAKPVAQSAAQQLRGLASQVQKILDSFANCSDLDFNCVIHELFTDLEGGGILGGLIGGIIGCLVTIVAGCIGGAIAGASIGGTIGALGGLGYFAYYEIVKHQTISMLQSLQGLLNSGASSLEHQQLDAPDAYDQLNHDYMGYDVTVRNFTANNNGQLSDRANAIANQAWQIYSQAINTESGYFCVCLP